MDPITWWIIGAAVGGIVVGGATVATINHYSSKKEREEMEKRVKELETLSNGQAELVKQLQATIISMQFELHELKDLMNKLAKASPQQKENAVRAFKIALTA